MYANPALFATRILDEILSNSSVALKCCARSSSAARDEDTPIEKGALVARFDANEEAYIGAAVTLKARQATRAHHENEYSRL